MIPNGHEDDVPDEWNERIQKTGCSEENERLQICFSQYKDWRVCQKQLQEFRDCWGKHMADQKPVNEEPEVNRA
ncbi:hypothetical protein TWF696_008815 [Orbilia brochopaga]|uniref:CHCH domain-containing protein n=1 Tax=Orbilia brochopaga TaxID=3140254 RepID=A0AAV9UI33_9PEZI